MMLLRSLEDLPVARFEQSYDDFHGGALAGAVRADVAKTKDFTGLIGEADVLDHRPHR